MEKRIIIAGAGMGSRADMTDGLLAAAGHSELIIGSERILRLFAGYNARMVGEYRADEIRKIVEEAEENKILILVSGDQGFFSAAKRIREVLSDYSRSVMPGISSVSYMSACTGIPWSGAQIVSAHGRNVNIVSAVRRNRVTYVLTGGNAENIIETLCRYGYGDIEVFAGERLSYMNGRISHGTAGRLSGRKFDPLSVMILINADASSDVPSGIPDAEFIRSSVPMTKRFFRAAAVSAMKLRSDSVVWDIGAGTGSVSVEAALAAYEGKVYAVERDERGIELIRRNAVKFHTDNIMCVCGEAPEALHDLPAPDVCFIGGAGGRLGQITDAVSRMMKDSVRIVITAVTLQTLTQASELLEKAGAEDISVSQIQVSETYKAGKYDIFKAQNPVFIIEAVLKRQK